MSGLQKGFEEGSGTRSSLLWHIRKAVIAKRPKYLLMENVRALTFKKNMPLFTKWQDELVSYGYTNYWQVLNATDFNVPQNRQRVFMISILNDEEGFTFPKPIGLTKTISDVLEENVDECYYLNQSVVNKYLEVTADTRHNHNLGLRKRSDIAYTIRTKSGGGRFGGIFHRYFIKEEQVCRQVEQKELSELPPPKIGADSREGGENDITNQPLPRRHLGNTIQTFFGGGWTKLNLCRRNGM